MAQVRFYNIDWSLINDVSKLPAEVTVQVEEELLDNEDAEQELSSVLLDQFGCEHNGFNYEVC